MSYQGSNLKKKSTISILIIVAVFLSIFALIAFYYFEWLWFIFLPIVFFIAIALQAMSQYFWEVQRYCPRCNAKVNTYADYCRNCGLKLIDKCPNCGKFSRVEDQRCDNCGYIFKDVPGAPKDIEELPYILIDEETPMPKKPNFCPECGIKLEPEQQNLRYCENCGSKLE
ncbi:MAG: double zinc ribbon domain-containing protein [Promethearchaeota archaeon]